MREVHGAKRLPADFCHGRARPPQMLEVLDSTTTPRASGGVDEACGKQRGGTPEAARLDGQQDRLQGSRSAFPKLQP